MDRVEVVRKGELENGSRWTMTVVDLAGRIIEQNQLNRFPYELSVTNYPLGIYFIRLENSAREFQMMKMMKI